MKLPVFCFISALLCAGCAGDRFHAGKAAALPRQHGAGTAYYLGTDAEKVEDTCPGNNILTQYNCTRKQENGYTCFDVYMAQGRPLNTQEYTLLQERVEKQAVTPQPQCPAMEPTCDAFLKALNYNLEFSWYLVNFPTSSFPQCRETYDCKRIDCYLPPAEGEKEATLVSWRIQTQSGVFRRSASYLPPNPALTRHRQTAPERGSFFPARRTGIY